MKKKRVGIFGGTFNPPHSGHVSSAKAFCQQLELDELLIIPAFLPPHKIYDSEVTCDERLEMCRLAFSSLKEAVISDIEIKRGGTSYTYLTLQELSQEGADLFLLCGTDMMLSLSEWKNPEIIFALANVCYVRREDSAENNLLLHKKCDEYKALYGAKIYEIASDVIEISSTEIRMSDYVAKEYLPKSVYNYIIEKGLYR